MTSGKSLHLSGSCFPESDLRDGMRWSLLPVPCAGPRARWLCSSVLVAVEGVD